MPFVTEYLYLNVPFVEDETIMLAPWPTPEKAHQYPGALSEFEVLKELISFVRQTRNTYSVPPKKPIDLFIETTHERLITKTYKIIEEFVHPKLFSMNTSYQPEAEDITYVGPGFTAYIPLGSLVDKAEEMAKQEAKLKDLEAEIKRAEGMLDNATFIAKAPKEKVQEERDKLAQYQAQYAELTALIKKLGGRV